MTKGLVIQASKNSYQVFYNNKIITCKSSSKNFLKNQVILTGDYVVFKEEDNFITKVLPRKNSLIRPKMSNVDLVFIVMSYVEPKFCEFTLTKLILFYQYFSIDPIIVLTKQDLVTKKFKNPLIEEYRQIGYKIIETNYHHFNPLKFTSLIKNKVAILAGHSGVGKTTIINGLIPSLNLKEGLVSKANKRGKHTTTSSTLFALGSGFICDTPGFAKISHKFFKDEVKFARLFNDFKKYASSCKFKNCLHYKEKECFVLSQVNFKISKKRYNIYIKLLKLILKDVKDDYRPLSSRR